MKNYKNYRASIENEVRMRWGETAAFCEYQGKTNNYT